MTAASSLELIFYKSLADLKAEAARSYLGILWWVIEPVLYLGSFYVLFEVILRRGDAQFVPMFLTGAVTWKWFDSGLKAGSLSIVTHLGLIQLVRVPKFAFPAIAVMGSSVRFAVVFALLCAFLALHGGSPGASWICLPLLLATQFLLVLGVAMLASALTPFVPDLKALIDNGLMLMFFLSGALYDLQRVDEPLRGYLLLNPMASLIDGYRAVLVRGELPSFLRLGAVALIALGLVGAGLAALRHLDRRFGKARLA